MRSLRLDRLPSTSLRVRLTIWNTVIVLLMTVSSLLAARYAARSTLYDTADTELSAAAREVALALADLDPNIDAVVGEMQRKATSHEKRGWFMHLLFADGTTIWKSEHCPEEVSNYPPALVDRVETIVQVGHYRYVRRRVDRSTGMPLLVRVGTYTTGLDESLTSLIRPLVAVGIVLTLLTPAVAYWLALRATRPVADILRTADRLSPTRLGDRLPERGRNDELDRLSRTINHLLDSVAEHVERQDQFVADAAHELRGPLAALQSSLEVELARDDGTGEGHERLTDILESTRHLSKVTNDLLVLAQTGRAPPASSLASSAIDLVARQAVAMFSGAAEERGVTLTLAEETDTAVAAEAADLRRLLSNLLDNAIRFTPEGGSIRVVIADDPYPGRVTLSVTDTGSGIAPSDLRHVFDRFYKSDTARSHGTGTRSGGLGLAICRAIADSCGGSIAITSRPGGGTTVTVRLRAAGPPSGERVVRAPATRVLQADWASRAGR